jgi:hypothetical protein
MCIDLSRVRVLHRRAAGACGGTPRQLVKQWLAEVAQTGDDGKPYRLVSDASSSSTARVRARR